jgi:uncharacterized protein (DUF342 family)
LKKLLNLSFFDAGVVFGVKNDVIEKVIKERWTYQQILVAEGKEPEEPVNASVDYKFKRTCEDSAAIDEYCCESGTVLAEKIPKKDGKPGHTVTGREIPAKLAKDIDMQLYAGENTKVEGDRIIVLIGGQVYIDEAGRVCVRNVLIIGEKELAAHQVFSFPGSIFVRCNIEGLYHIHAGKDVSINGIVSGGVEIKAGGDVSIAGGFFGRGKGKIVADGSVSMQFISEGLVIAKKDVRVKDYIMNSEVISGRSILVSRKGLIVGGKVKAVEFIEARQLGNESGVSTYVEVGIDYEYETKRADLNHRLRLLVEELGKWSALSQQLRSLYNNLIGRDKEKVKSAILRVEEKRKDVVSEINHLREKLKELRYVNIQELIKINPRIFVKETCFAGVNITIFGESYNVNYELGPRALDLHALKQLKYGGRT